MTISTSDSRWLWRVDANLAFASQVANANTHIFQGAPWASLQSISESGVTDPNTGTMAFDRVADPAGGSGSVFLCRTSKTFDDWANTGLYKTEVLCPSVADAQCYNAPDPVWFAFGVMFGADILTAGNYTNVFDFHVDEGSSVVQFSPINMIVANGVVTLYRSSKLNPSNASDRDTEAVLSFAVEAGVWYRFVVQMKMSHLASNSPYLRVWAQKGTGPLTQYVDESHIIGYSDNGDAYYQKFGAYQYNTAGTDTATLYYTGFWIINDTAPGSGEPTLNEYEMLALVGGGDGGGGGGGGGGSTTPAAPEALYTWAAVSADENLYAWANLDQSAGAGVTIDSASAATIAITATAGEILLNYGPPAVTTTSLTAATEGASGSQGLTLTGPGTVTVTATGVPPAATLASNGTLSWTTAILAGTYTLVVTPTSSVAGVGEPRMLQWVVQPVTTADPGAWASILRGR